MTRFWQSVLRGVRNWTIKRARPPELPALHPDLAASIAAGEAAKARGDTRAQHHFTAAAREARTEALRNEMERARRIVGAKQQ